MADGVFNIAKGRAAYYGSLPGADDALVVVLLKAVESDDVLRDHRDLSALLAAAGNTEADFTGYARITATGVTVAIDDVANRVDADCNDATWADAGGAVDNTTAKLLICYKPTAGSADAAIIPLTYHDFVVTTDGSSITAQVATDGFYGAS